MNIATPSKQSIYYPPGGILIWMIIFLELITFSAFLIVLTVKSEEAPSLFHESRLMLNANLGFINTVVLLISGFFMASATNQLLRENTKKSSFYLKLSILGGMVFLLIKSVEYYHKIESGHVFGTNTFFDFYWLLTSFHALHVMVGLIILITLLLKMKRCSTASFTNDFEAGAAFWHMCDLIWLLIFPMLYLIF